jgi:DNA-binding transcriptional MerR regulator
MSYTVKKLAQLSGVSIRTLRFYDAIGLLKPAYYGDNNYRYYEDEQILLLQQILFYRELNIPLNDIQWIISSDDFNKIDALISHKQSLAQKLDRTKNLIKTIDQTMAHLRGKKSMSDEELFTRFAHKFAFDLYVTAFAPGNDNLLDQYFASDLVMFNHVMSKQLELQDLKSIHDARIHNKLLSNRFSKPLVIAPFSNRVIVSIEKDENVVYPPRNPMSRNERNSDPMPSILSIRRTKRKPIKRHPLTLTRSVP